MDGWGEGGGGTRGPAGLYGIINMDCWPDENN